MKKYENIETALVHGGIYGDPLTGSVNVPIYQTSTYEQDTPGKPKGQRFYEYSRTGNPTREALEAMIAELEGGVAGFAYASGMAAITSVLDLLESGDEVIISSNVYGGTFRVLDKVFSRFGLRYRMVDTSDIAAVEAAIVPETAAIMVESPANPLLTVTDLAAIAGLAHRHGLLAIADNTFMSPYLQRPIELGFDIVVHSATKYLGGHSDLVAGLAVTNSPELAERMAFNQNSTGGVLGPFDSFLLLRGIKTLGVRMDRHVANAERIAAFLSGHPFVRKVYYPGLPDFPGHDVCFAQAKNGGAMMSFEMVPEADVNAFFRSLQLVSLAESLGGVESLVCHPATMTHAAIPAEVRERVGITDTLVRLSVGIENSDDLVADLDQAIRSAVAAGEAL